MTTSNIKLSELPEEVTENGLKIYGPTSYFCLLLQQNSIIKHLNITIMKPEENKKQEELTDEQLDYVVGGGKAGKVSKKVIK